SARRYPDADRLLPRVLHLQEGVPVGTGGRRPDGPGRQHLARPGRPRRQGVGSLRQGGLGIQGLVMLSNLHASPLVLAPLAAGALLMGILFAAGKVPLSYNVRNLVVRWPITLLTVLAFIMVIGLMTVMLAFVNGMYRLTVDSGVPGNVIVFSDGATD